MATAPSKMNIFQKFQRRATEEVMPSLFMYDMPILVAFIGLCQGRQSVSKSLNQAV